MIKSPAMPATQQQLLQALIKTKSFQFSATPTFKLASGAMSQFYVDCRIGISYPETRQIVGELMLSRVQQPIDAVGGLLVAAYPIAVALSDAAHAKNSQLIRAFFVRKEPKAHGMKKMVEGAVNEGDRVLVVDDVITSGKSTIEAIEKCRDAGLVVKQAMVIIDREEQEGRAKIEALGVKVDALCTLAELQKERMAATAGY
jgi:orotate phosphoribosyltransferase